MSSNNPYAEDFDDNPFRSPEVLDDSPGLRSAAEAIRNEHLSHEASVKSIGFLYILGAVFMIIGSIVMFVALTAAAGAGRGVGNAQVSIGLFVVLAAVGVLQFATGLGLRRLRGWARIPSGILSAIGLLGFPIGTLINGYILYLLFSEKGTMVFSDKYQEIMAQTPHIQYKTSIIVWIFLGLLLLLIGVGVIAAIIG